MKTLMLCVVVVALTLNCGENKSTNSTPQTWIRFYEEIPSKDIAAVSDGGCIVVGTDTRLGQDVATMTRISDDGKLLWKNTYGAADTNTMVRSVIPVTAGGFLVVGSKYANDPFSQDVYLIRVTESGDTLWTSTLGTEYNDVAYAATQTASGGFAITGSTEPAFSSATDVLLIITDSKGQLECKRTYGDSGWEEGRSILQASDGGFIIAGREISTREDWDIQIIRTDSVGDTVWITTFGGDEDDVCYDAVQLSDGSVIMAGETIFSAGEPYRDIYLVKVDVTGSLSWQKHYGGDQCDFFEAIVTNPDGAILIAGTSCYHRTPRLRDIYIMNVDGNGDKIWDRYYGDSIDVWCISASNAADGGFFLLGEKAEVMPQVPDTIILIKTDRQGEVE